MSSVSSLRLAIVWIAHTSVSDPQHPQHAARPGLVGPIRNLSQHHEHAYAKAHTSLRRHLSRNHTLCNKVHSFITLHISRRLKGHTMSGGNEYPVETAKSSIIGTLNPSSRSTSAFRTQLRLHWEAPDSSPKLKSLRISHRLQGPRSPRCCSRYRRDWWRVMFLVNLVLGRKRRQSQQTWWVE